MVDPIVGAVMAKTANALQTEGSQVAPGLLKSVLGPPAEALGDALRRTVAYRTRNFGRIVEKANTRLHGKDNNGTVNLRVAFSLLEEGSLCDDELMAEYLGGLLAGSKSPDGRDDRAVTWTRIVTGLSSFQIRAHYLLYRDLAVCLHEEAPDLDLSYKTEMKKVSIYLDRDEFEIALVASTQDNSEDSEAILRHAIHGLCRAGLVNDSWAYGRSLLRITPTGRGIELYGWVLGLTDLLPRNFASRAFPLEIPSEIPHLKKMTLRDLHKPFEDDAIEIDDIEEDDEIDDTESEINSTDS
jgi:hypothetical protein